MKPFTEVNLTPLIDLTFLLLVTFIITFPQLEQGIPVNLPKANAADKMPPKSHTISVDKAGLYYLDSKKVSLAELSDSVTDLAKKDADVAIRVRADEGIKYANVVSVMKILHDNKITKMALVTQGENKPGRR